MEHQYEPDFTRLRHGADFYFVRHGESQANRDNVIQGRHNAPLTEEGRRQAEAVGSWFAGCNIDIVYASPLQRAFETASIVSTCGRLPQPTPAQQLVELDTGIFSGLSTTQIKERYPQEWSRFQEHSWEAVPDAESVDSLRSRALAHWNTLIKGAEDGRRSSLSVTHGGMVQWLIKVTIGSTSWMPLFSASNCGIFHLTIRPISEEQRASFFREWRLINHLVYTSP